MLKETEWIGSCKINARICFDLPGLRCSTLYNGGLGGARGTSAAKEKTSLPEQGSVWPQDTTSVYFASTGITPEAPPARLFWGVLGADN